MSETIGALVVVYKNGSKATFRWIKEWDFKYIAKRDLENAKQQLARVAELGPVKTDAQILSESAFQQKYGQNRKKFLAMFKNPVDVSTMALWTIEQLPFAGLKFLTYNRGFQINFGDVLSVALKEKQSIE